MFIDSKSNKNVIQVIYTYTLSSERNLSLFFRNKYNAVCFKVTELTLTFKRYCSTLTLSEPIGEEVKVCPKCPNFNFLFQFSPKKIKFPKK